MCPFERTRSRKRSKSLTRELHVHVVAFKQCVCLRKCIRFYRHIHVHDCILKGDIPWMSWDSVSWNLFHCVTGLKRVKGFSDNFSSMGKPSFIFSKHVMKMLTYHIYTSIQYKHFIPQGNFQWFNWSISNRQCHMAKSKCRSLLSINVGICFRNGIFGIIKYTRNQWKRNTCIFDIFSTWTCPSIFCFNHTTNLYICY